LQVVVEMSMPAGRAPTYIIDLKTGERVAVRSVVNLPRDFRNFKDVMTVKDEEGKVKADRVLFRVEGIVDGVQLSTHKINLYTQKSVPPTLKEAKQLDGDHSDILGLRGVSELPSNNKTQ
jgi:hypothetical protein